MMKLAMHSAMVVALLTVAAGDPFASLTQDEKTLLKPQIERWMRDQIKHDWADMWEIQDQTSELKNELLLGRRDAPDMDRNQYVNAMREISVSDTQNKAFTLREIRREDGGFWILGCGKLQRESWKETSITDVHARVLKGKVIFGLPGMTPESCKL